jgi:aspartyl-tRNA(Asn)/glutamyl-tRNA(Gln) amidotransferase subunit B
MSETNKNIIRGYEPVIGLEIHSQLKTNTKLFCGCSTSFGAEPNTQVCPVCLGMPGVLPVMNKRAVEFAVMMGLATECEVRHKSVFSRKNYFYPDLPKGYQISQYDLPICEHGKIEIEINDKKKTIGITRIHMEEDAGKLLHGSGPEEASFSFVDLNRSCTPLIEIVSEPDIRCAEEAVEYLKAIHNIVVYLGVSDGNMDEGSFRCDANISVRPVGREKFGTRTELKNINSFKFVKDAIRYEIERQIDAIEDGEEIIQETRLYDSAKGVTVSMRSKEEAHDYRYFPEPDLLPLEFDDAFVEEARGKLPELPAMKKARFISEYSLPPYDAGVLTAEQPIADFYEETVKIASDAKVVSNWVMGELMRLLNDAGQSITDCKVTSSALASLLEMLDKGTINAKTAKEVFEEVFKTGKDPKEIVKASGATQISDTDELASIIDGILEGDADSVARYKGGETKLMGFFVGQVMKATKGQGNPKVINQLLREKLEG